MLDPSVRRVLMTAAAVLLATGCGADADPPAATPRTSVSTTSPQVPTTTAVAPTTTVAPTTPPLPTSAPFAAADGTNLDACADGTCEVFVETGDSLPNASGTGAVTITVRNGMITISQRSASGMSSNLSGRPGMPQRINDQVFLPVAVEGDRGVLRLSTS